MTSSWKCWIDPEKLTRQMVIRSSTGTCEDPTFQLAEYGAGHRWEDDEVPRWRGDPITPQMVDALMESNAHMIDHNPSHQCDALNKQMEETIMTHAKYTIPDIDEVIFNEAGRATVIRWADGKKTVVHCGEGETFDRYTGFIACIAKKMFGDTASAKKLMNSKDKKYQAQLKAEREAAEKAKRQEEAAAAKAKADKARAKEYEDTMNDMVQMFLMSAEAKQLAEKILRERAESAAQPASEEGGEAHE